MGTPLGVHRSPFVVHEAVGVWRSLGAAGGIKRLTITLTPNLNPLQPLRPLRLWVNSCSPFASSGFEVRGREVYPLVGLLPPELLPSVPLNPRTQKISTVIPCVT
jgi:hypothetical protein